MQKEEIIEKLKANGCRITKQRITLIDIILEGDFSCCKEIYYKARKVNDNIGFATVYRMVNMLEEIGAIDRSNMYKVTGNDDISKCRNCKVTLSDDTIHRLDSDEWEKVLREGLKACGFLGDQSVQTITVDIDE